MYIIPLTRLKIDKNYSRKPKIILLKGEVFMNFINVTIAGSGVLGSQIAFQSAFFASM